jgi:hypothetical protein
MVNTYLFYLAISIALTVWVGHTLHKNGRPFLLHAFDDNALTADSINNLLLVGFYLINFGFVTLALRSPAPIIGLQGAIELLSVKIGKVLLVLGGMHFFNMHMLHKLGRRRPWIANDSPPPLVPRPQSPPGLGQTVLRGAA